MTASSHHTKYKYKLNKQNIIQPRTGVEPSPLRPSAVAARRATADPTISAHHGPRRRRHGLLCLRRRARARDHAGRWCRRRRRARRDTCWE